MIRGAVRDLVYTLGVGMCVYLAALGWTERREAAMQSAGTAGLALLMALLIAQGFAWLRSEGIWPGGVWEEEEPAAKAATTEEKVLDELDWFFIEYTYGKTTYRNWVPLDEHQMRLIGMALLGGDRFAMDRWGPWFRGTRREYLQVRAGFLAAGILEWVDPGYRRLGMQLTPGGMYYLREVLKVGPPTPSEVIYQILDEDVRGRT